MEKLDLNTASRDELLRLPGIGVRLADRLIEYRDQYGRITKFDALRACGFRRQAIEQLKNNAKI